VLVVMHGLSGSGKSVVSAALAAGIGAVRLRSDVERKRLHRLVLASRAGAHGAMYAPAARDAVYERLGTLARRLLALDCPVVVDAAFLDAAQRRRFVALAAEAGVDFVMVELVAPESVLRARIGARAAASIDASDADLAVLDAQLAAYRPPGDEERACALRWDATAQPSVDAIVAAWRAHRDAAGGAAR
jgi:predicted kinase